MLDFFCDGNAALSFKGGYVFIKLSCVFSGRWKKGLKSVDS